MKIRKTLNFLAKCLPFLTAAAILFAVIFYPHGREEPSAQTVLRLWNVDTFEGGRGSRTSFLRRVSENYRKDVFVLVTSYTAAGAEEAMERGEFPDLISFGIGFSAHLGYALPLDEEFAGGRVNGKTLAVPWCKSAYFLFSLTEDFGREGKTAISSGGSNLSVLAALLSDIAGEEMESQAAYTGFLGGKYRYLVGTMRDVCRFRARGTEVFSKPLGAFNDLYQCLSVLTESTAAREFAAYLLSVGVQKKLGEIGLLPAGENEGKTVSVFTDGEGLERIRSYARAGDKKNLDNFLKTV